MEAINRRFGSQIATAIDPSTVRLNVPENRTNDIVGLITEIEQLQVEPDQVARVVINERTGVIVMGEEVRISTVAIAQGNLTITITETPQVSQPQPLANGQTTVVPRTSIEVDTGEESQIGVLSEEVTLQDMVQGLNALGIAPRDLMAILQSIHAAGALQATIEAM